MKYFETILKGFDGSTDATDHLVKWISAPNIEAATRAVTIAGWELERPIEELPYEEGSLSDETIDLHVKDDIEIHS